MISAYQIKREYVKDKSLKLYFQQSKMIESDNYFVKKDDIKIHSPTRSSLNTQDSQRIFKNKNKHLNK